MPQSSPESILSPRSSLSSSPCSSASSINSPPISDSNWARNYSRDSEQHSNLRHRLHRHPIHSPALSSNSLPTSMFDRNSEPMTPWNLRSDLILPEDADGRQGHHILNLDADDVLDENETAPPLYLGHTRWKQTQGTPGHHHTKLPGDKVALPGGRVVNHRKSRSKMKHPHRIIYYEQHLSRDFFLILTLCFVLACFLFCLTRPTLHSWFASPAFLLGLDEL